jgi:hypothetical protein
MDKKTIVSLIVILIGITGLVWWSKVADSRALRTSVGGSHPAITGAADGKLTAEETVYDFGKISMKDGNVTKVFKVSNTGSEDVNLTNISTSCMCTAAYLLRADGSKIGPFGMPGHGGNTDMPGHGGGKAGEIITAGESREIEVVYDPNAHGPAGIGTIDRFVYLQDENGAKLELEIKAQVTP